jgi:hypothetical protein
MCPSPSILLAFISLTIYSFFNISSSSSLFIILHRSSYPRPCCRFFKLFVLHDEEISLMHSSLPGAPGVFLSGTHTHSPCSSHYSCVAVWSAPSILFPIPVMSIPLSATWGGTRWETANSTRVLVHLIQYIVSELKINSQAGSEVSSLIMLSHIKELLLVGQVVWTALIWLRIGTSRVLSWT